VERNDQTATYGCYLTAVIRNHLPKEFIREYLQRQTTLDAAIEDIKSTLLLRISQLNGQKGTRCRLAESRIKRPAKLWKKAQSMGFTIEDSFTRIVDLLGVRIVCNNLQDIDSIIEMIQTTCHKFVEIEIKNMVDTPTETGYTAVH
jgi:putative GTP pyrophosphokinase